MKRIRLISLLLSWASFLCLCSVGFSSWYQFDPVNYEAHGSFVGYGVIGMDECVYAEAGSFRVFEYSSLSFVESTSESKLETDTGVISVIYVVDLAKAKTAMEAAGKTWNGTLSIEIGLSYENIADYGESGFAGLFGPPVGATSDDVKSVTALVNDSAPTGGVTVGGEEIVLTQVLEGLGETGTVRLNVSYRFNIPKCYADGTTVGNFRNHFGKYLKTSDAEDKKATQFVTEARITELLA